MHKRLTNLAAVLTELAERAGREPKSVRDWVARHDERLPEQRRPFFARRLDGNAGWLVNRHHPPLEHSISNA